MYSCTKKREKSQFEPEPGDHNHLEHNKRKRQSTERRPMGERCAVHGAERSNFEQKAPKQPPVSYHTSSIDLTDHSQPQASWNQISWQKLTNSCRHFSPLCPKDQKRNTTISATGTSPHEHAVAKSQYCKHTIYLQQQRNCSDTWNKIVLAYNKYNTG